MTDYAPDGAATVREVASAVIAMAQCSAEPSPFGPSSRSLGLGPDFFDREVHEQVHMGCCPGKPAEVGELVRFYIHEDCLIPAAANLRRLVLEVIGERIEGVGSVRCRETQEGFVVLQVQPVDPIFRAIGKL